MMRLMRHVGWLSMVALLLAGGCMSLTSTKKNAGFTLAVHSEPADPAHPGDEVFGLDLSEKTAELVELGLCGILDLIGDPPAACMAPRETAIDDRLNSIERRLEQALSERPLAPPDPRDGA